VIVVAMCAGLLRYRGFRDMEDGLAIWAVVVLIIAAIHALYFAFVVAKAGVKKTAQKYGRELILSTETLMGGTRVHAVPRKPKEKAK